MSDEEFLKRWSRRKQEAKQEPSKAGEQAPPHGQTAAASPETAEVASEPEIDLSKLPSIDSITAATDITEFLRKGIPDELSRAALRRAWAADPAIRDFVGLAENAWDFTDPSAIPGFGALQGTPEQIGAMVERVLGGVRNAADKLVESPEKEQERAKADQERVSATEAVPDEAKNATGLSDLSTDPVAAAQPEASDEKGGVMPARRRTHGGALPS
jgi:Protein of unknown function (DUF3306)